MKKAAAIIFTVLLNVHNEKSYPVYAGSHLLQQTRAQNINDIITPARVEQVEKTLSSDAMQGRKTFSTGISSASTFIESEFKQAGLQFLPGLNTYKQDFLITSTKNNTAKVTIDGVTIADTSLVVVSYKPSVTLTQSDTVEIIHINSLQDLQEHIQEIFKSEKDQLVLTDPSIKQYSNILREMGSTKMDVSSNSIVFVFGIKEAKEFTIELNNDIDQQTLNNVAGMLPGKSKPGEYVIFSGHYDHLGIEAPDTNNDSIFNGANDDASGTTAVVMLSNYFKALGNNERTLLFVAFTAEEIGGFGSQYFSQQFPDPSRVVAMFNIEMIGTESKWGTNSAYITGYEKTDMGKILEKNLEGSQFKFYPDPYPEQQLFYRSDNATLARVGVPAHTISTSKMDSEKFYHTKDDEFETLDMKNMTEIIKAIALSSVSIISGKDTPSRVDTSQLK